MPRRLIPLPMWAVVHRWTSLVCTLFMVLLCLTGLPLIFHHEIDQALGDVVEPPPSTVAGRAGLDRVMATAYARHPGKVALFASQEIDDDRVWFVTMASTPTSSDLVQVAVDARDAALLAEPVIGGTGPMSVILSLHVDLFAGLAGKLFLGAMGVLLLASLVSGVVLYAPFMRKLDFGTVRRDRARRVRWLDLHNLIGIATLAWVFVVGATGVVNTWAELLLAHWQKTEMAAMVSAYDGLPPVTEPMSPQRSLSAALAREPGMKVGFVAFPGSSFSSPHHYGVFMRGDTPLTSRLFKPVLVDARTGVVTDSRDLPWYLTALLLSQPLHFGDYGGLPLKLVWAGLDVATLIVLGSGLYLWIARARRARGAPVRLERRMAS